MALTSNQLTVGLLGVAAGGFETAVDDFITANGAAAAADVLLPISALNPQILGEPIFNNEKFAEMLSANFLGTTSADVQAGVSRIIVDFMAANPTYSRGAVAVALIEALLAVPLTDPTLGASRAAFETKVERADAYTGTSTDLDVLADVIGEPASTVGETFMLTASTDRGADFAGTAFADSFFAYLSQNSTAGGVSNTLSSADVLSGGAGADSLYAELVAEFFGTTGDNQIDVQPRISGIETIEIEARDSGSNDVNANVLVTVDAKYITGVNNIGSTFSDGDLVIENLTTLTDGGVARNTDSITVTMDHTDNFNSDGDASDLTVLFDDDYILSGQTAEASAFFFLLDEDADLISNPNRLDRINVDGLRFSLDGGATIIDLDNPAAQLAGTHAGFVAALQGELADLIAAGTVPTGTTLTLDTTRVDYTYLDDGSLSAAIPAIVLTSGDGTVVTPIGYSQVEEAIGAYDVYGRFGAESAVADEPVTVNVELDKVGRAGEGGNLDIGSKDGATGPGIEVFNVAVLGAEDKPSNLGHIISDRGENGGAAGTLQDIYISTHEDYVGGASFASLTVRGTAVSSPFGDGNELVDADAFLGDLSLGEDFALYNLDMLTAQGGGDVFYNATIDGTEQGVAWRYTTGSGEDTAIVMLDGDAVDTIGESFSVVTNSGDDSVSLTMGLGVSQRTMEILDDLLTISTGDGADAVNLDAYGNFDINAGSGSDFVRINSEDANGNGTTGAWTFGQPTGPQLFGERVLYSATLTVSFAGFESKVNVETNSAGKFIADQGTINAAIQAAIAANPELTELLTVTMGTGDRSITITSDVAGANSLSIALYQPQLVSTNAGAGQVVLSSGDLTAIRQGLIDTTALTSQNLETVAEVVTEFNAGDLFGSVAQDGTGDENVYTRVSNDVAQSRPDSGIDIFDAAAAVDLYQAYSLGGSSNSTTGINFSTIDMGTGSNDLVVLHSNLASSNILKFSAAWGKVSVVNFHDVQTNLVDDATDVGLHALDFTTWLNNDRDPSVDPTGNLQSVEDIPVTLNIVNGAEALTGLSAGATNTALAVANSVNVLRFNSTVDATETFSGLNQDNLKSALNATVASSEYGNLNDARLSAANYGIAAGSANALVGSTQKHIVMVENDLNEGEYKVFYLTSNITTAGAVTNGDFATSNYLGTIDFGASINVQLAGSAAYELLREAQLAAADGYVDPVEPIVHNLTVPTTANEGDVLTYSATVSGYEVGDHIAASFGGTATSGADYTTTGQFTVVNATTATMQVAVTNDTAEEAAETIVVSVAGLSGTTTISANDTPIGGRTEVDLLNNGTQDASTGAFEYNINLTGINDVLAATVNGFTGDDAFDVDNALINAASLNFDTTTTNGRLQINMAVGDMTDFIPAMIVNINVADAALVAAVEAAADSAAVIGILNTAWGTDWLV